MSYPKIHESIFQLHEVTGQRMKPVLIALRKPNSLPLKEIWANRPSNKLLNRFEDETVHRTTRSQPHEPRHPARMDTLLPESPQTGPKGSQVKIPMEEEHPTHNVRLQLSL